MENPPNKISQIDGFYNDYNGKIPIKKWMRKLGGPIFFGNLHIYPKKTCPFSAGPHGLGPTPRPQYAMIAEAQIRWKRKWFVWMGQSTGKFPMGQSMSFLCPYDSNSKWENVEANKIQWCDWNSLDGTSDYNTNIYIYCIYIYIYMFFFFCCFFKHFVYHPNMGGVLWIFPFRNHFHS